MTSFQDDFSQLVNLKLPEDLRQRPRYYPQLSQQHIGSRNTLALSRNTGTDPMELTQGLQWLLEKKDIFFARNS